jgi:hypothetical protein
MRLSDNHHGLTWLEHPLPGSAEAYAFATFLVVIAALIRWGLSFISLTFFSLRLFTPALHMSAFDGGFNRSPQHRS